MHKTFPAALACLQEHKVLAYPTETFYGLGCLALEAQALERLSFVKRRDTSTKPYPLIIGAMEHLEALAATITPEASRLMEAFWPGPLTLVLAARDGLDPRIVGPTGGVAVRLSSHPIAQWLAKACGQAIVSTSANLPQQPPPREASDVRAYFPPEEVTILDGGSCAGGAPSTIVDVSGTQARLLRQGAIATEALAPYISLDDIVPTRN